MSRLLPDNVDVVIYHHPCADGMGSAFCCLEVSINQVS